MTSGLVAEIQRDALNNSIPVTTLLRKVLLAAGKLKLSTVERWVEQELKGYDKIAEVPEYRKVRGQARAWNPFHGWIPMGGKAELMDVISEAKLHESMGVMEGFLQDRSSAERFHIPFSPGKLEVLSKVFETELVRAGLDISSGSITHVVESVRNLVLEWSIELEKAGITGEGLSFTADEQVKAQAASHSFNIGTISNFTGNLGTGNVSGDITNAPISVETVHNLLSQIKSYSNQLTSEGVDSAALAVAIEKVEARLADKNPTLLKLALRELQAVVAKATGKLVATGVLTLLHQILGTGVPS